MNGLQPAKKRKLLPLSEVELQSSEAPVLENESPCCTIFVGQDSSSDHHCPNDTYPLNQPWSSYWDSPEAIKLFRVREGETTQEAINNQIIILTKANRSDDSYLEVIHGSEALEEENTLTSFEKHAISKRKTW